MSGDSQEGRALAAIEASEAAELAVEIEAREQAARRHTLWALLGVSPAGLIPLLAASSDFGVAALLTGAVCITGIEAWRALRARAEAAELRDELRHRASSTTSMSD